MDPREQRTTLLAEAGKLLLRTVFEFSSFLIFETELVKSTKEKMKKPRITTSFGSKKIANNEKS